MTESVGVARAAVIAGIGGCVPPRVVTNEELGRRLDVDDEWIRSRTGIGLRHMVDPDVATGDLAVLAGERALKSAGCGVGAVIVATSTPDHQIPATAPWVATRLGLSGVMAFDLNAVCTGFVYGLATGSALISGGLVDQVLVIGADAYSRIMDPDNRVTYPLFGDGAGAVVLRAGHPAEPGALTCFDLGSDGGLHDLIILPAGGSRQRLSEAPSDTYLALSGKQVFVNAVKHMAVSARTVLERAGRTAAEIDRVVGHQANVRILRALSDQLGIPPERLVMNIDRVGNTSAASIPLALVDAVAGGSVKSGHRVLLTAFGGGLTWGSTVVDWPDLTIIEA